MQTSRIAIIPHLIVCNVMGSRRWPRYQDDLAVSFVLKSETPSVFGVLPLFDAPRTRRRLGARKMNGCMSGYQPVTTLAADRSCPC